MTLREQMEKALVANEVCSPYELEQQHEKSILNALLPVVETAVAAERERCARIIDHSMCDVAEDQDIFMAHRDYFAAAIRAA